MDTCAAHDVAWEVDAHGRMAVAYWVRGDWLVLYAFVVTSENVVDIAGFRVDAFCESEHPSLVDRVRSIIMSWSLDRPRVGLTSAEIGAVKPGRSLLVDARLQLAAVSAPTSAPKPRVRMTRRGTVLDDRHYADVAVRYERQFRIGPGARTRLAAELGVSENTTRDRIKEAKNRGFWLTSGRGRWGTASPAAYQYASAAVARSDADSGL